MVKRQRKGLQLGKHNDVFVIKENRDLNLILGTLFIDGALVNFF